MSKPYGFTCDGAYPDCVRIMLAVPATVPDPDSEEEGATKQVCQAQLQFFGDLVDAKRNRCARFVWGMSVPQDQYGDPEPVVLAQADAPNYPDIQEAFGVAAVRFNEVLAASKLHLVDYVYEIEPGEIQAMKKKKAA